MYVCTYIDSQIYTQDAQTWLLLQKTYFKVNSEPTQEADGKEADEQIKDKDAGIYAAYGR